MKRHPLKITPVIPVEKEKNKRKPFWWGIFWVLFCLAGCQKEAPLPKVKFTALGLEVSGLKEKTPLHLLDQNGRLLLSYPPLSSQNVLLVFPWEPKTRYFLKSGPQKITLTSPETRPLAEVRVFAPLGAPGKGYLLFPEETKKKLSFFARKECSEIGLLFTSYASSLELILPDGEKRPLPQEFTRFFWRSEICLSKGEERELVFSLKGRDSVRFSLILRREAFDLAANLSFVSWRIPTDEFGYALRVRREGLLVLPNPFFERLTYFLGLKAQGYSRYAPFAYETIVLENKGPVAVNLLLKADFLDPETKEPVKGFYPPRFGMRGHYRKPMALAYLPPGERVSVVLPIYADAIAPGTYLARLKVFPFGEDKPLWVKERLIGVTRGSPALVGALILILTLGAGYSLWCLFRVRSLLASFSLRELSLVSLSGAVAFGLDFLGGLISNLIYALLGPFNILVGGLITEVVHYAIFTAVFVLVPKPGYATLAGLLHYLMGIVLFGGIRATDPFFLGFALFSLEGSLWLTRASKRPISAVPVLALATADAINTVSSLVLHMTFYRLFFPSWYLVLDVVVKGFFYTLLGAGVGVRIGKHLLGLER